MKYEAEIDLDNLNNSQVQIIKRVPEGSDVLEFGCSTGFVSRHLKEKGCTVTGIEINSEAAAKAGEFCDKVIVVDIDKHDFKKEIGKKFDAIIFGDVLEHLKEPEKTLEYVSDMLKEDGRIIASIPNVSFGYYRMEHLKGNFDYEDSGILDRSHLRFFDKNSVFALFELAGYYIKSVFRIKSSVSKVYLRDTLQKIGMDGSDEAVKNIRDMLDFEVFQYIVTALPANEGNSLTILREKEADYVTRLREINERLFDLREQLELKENHIKALEERQKHHENQEEQIRQKETHISNLEGIIRAREINIDSLMAKLKIILSEVNGF